jgi:predicted metal-dependent phosphoesterase TrpH
MMPYDTPGGAEFIKADLHLHTPDSYDYEEDIGPEEMIEVFEEEDLELVAVTDHNTTGFYDELAEAAEDSSVTVLPGVEITTGNSGENQIHITAIFPPEQASDVDRLLVDVDIEDDAPQEELSGQTIPNVCEAVWERGGLPILAHIDEDAGAHEELSNNLTRQRVFDPDNVAALEVVSPETAEEFPEFAHVRSSDAHSLSEIGRGYTFLKMDDPSFEGLRTALADPESRISLQTEGSQDHASVDGLLVNDGFLQARHLHLNCLIGGKGTGKSTVLEHIRYALNVAPRSDTIQEEYEALIDSTLAPDGEVRLLLTANNGEQYRITRQYNEEPTIERLSRTEDEEPDEISIPIERFRSQFFDVEIHSQRELLELARSELDQLDLLDSYFDVDSQLEDRKEVKDRIREKSREVATLEERVAELQDKKERYDLLEEQVETMREKGVEEYVEEADDWEAERAELSRLIDQIDELQEEVDELELTEIVGDAQVGSGPNEGLLTEAQETVQGLNSDLSDIESDLTDTVDQAREDISDIRDKWNEANDERESRHEELAEEIEEEIGVDIEDFFEKLSKLEDLRGVSDNLEEAQDNLRQAWEARQGLFEELDEARESLTAARREGIQDLNGELNNVRVSLREQSNRSEYTDWLNHVLEGSYVNTDSSQRRSIHRSWQRSSETSKSRDWPRRPRSPRRRRRTSSNTAT